LWKSPHRQHRSGLFCVCRRLARL